MYIRRRSWVSELEIGESFYDDDLYIENIENAGVIAMYEKDYRMTGGRITIQSIDDYHVKIKFNDLQFELKSFTNMFGDDYYPQNPTTHIVNGTVTFHNSLFQNGGWLPFG